MSRIWPADSIRELLTAAELVGAASATLETPEDASRFRFAIYTFRKQNALGEDLVVTVTGNVVVVSRPKVHNISIEVPGSTIEEGS